MLHKFIFCFLIFTVLSGCSTTKSRYQQKHDSVPTRIPYDHELQDPVPRDEPKSRGGNKKHYQVFGKSYNVLDSAEGFTETGIASFYGEKFHGHLTSNGEIYNMYSMTAAHKNLPLPTYVKVTNLNNNKTIIVRVNDRGPFHEGRIIDLSYGAAYKLGFTKKGTAPVKIEAITHFSSPKVTQTATNTPVAKEEKTPPKKQNIIQVFASKNKQQAEKLVKALAALYQQPVKVMSEKGLHRVIIGPIENASERFLLLQTLKGNGYENAFSKEIVQP